MARQRLYRNVKIAKFNLLIPTQHPMRCSRFRYNAVAQCYNIMSLASRRFQNPFKSLSRFSLIDLFLLVERHLPWAHIDQKQQPSHNGEDLEEVVFGEVLVRVVCVELQKKSALGL